MKFVNITGKKETKGFSGAVVQTTCTTGDFKISPAAAEQLGIKDGNNVLFVQDPDTKVTYIAKGIDSTPVYNEDGSVTRDLRGRQVFEEGSGVGAVARPSAEGSINFKVTGAFAWSQLGGNANMLRDFTLGEPETDELPTGNGDETVTTLFYPLVFKSEKPKMARGGEKGNITTTTAVATDVETEATEVEGDNEEFEQEEI